MQKSKLDVRKNGEVKKIWELVLQDRILPSIFISSEVLLLNVIFIHADVADKSRVLLPHGFKIVPASQAGLIKPAWMDFRSGCLLET